MTVSLTPELERFVAERVESGNYATPGEVVREALALLQERDEAQVRRLEQLRREIQVGLDQLERGQYMEYDSAGLRNHFDKIKEEGRKRLQADQS